MNNGSARNVAGGQDLRRDNQLSEIQWQWVLRGGSPAVTRAASSKAPFRGHAAPEKMYAPRQRCVRGSLASRLLQADSCYLQMGFPEGSCGLAFLPCRLCLMKKQSAPSRAARRISHRPSCSTQPGPPLVSSPGKKRLIHLPKVETRFFWGWGVVEIV